MPSAAYLNKKVIDSYSKALFRSAKEKSDIEKQFILLSEILEESPQIRKFLSAPIIKISEKLSLIDFLVNKGGFSKLMHNFLNILVEFNRIDHIKAIIENYKLLMIASRGEKNIEIVTTYKLSAKEKTDLKKKISKIFACKIHLETKINKDIIGGMTISDSVKMFDGSIRNRLRKFENLVKENIKQI